MYLHVLSGSRIEFMAGLRKQGRNNNKSAENIITFLLLFTGRKRNIKVHVYFYSKKKKC